LQTPKSNILVTKSKLWHLQHETALNTPKLVEIQPVKANITKTDSCDRHSLAKNRSKTIKNQHFKGLILCKKELNRNQTNIFSLMFLCWIQYNCPDS